MAKPVCVQDRDGMADWKNVWGCIFYPYHGMRRPPSMEGIKVRNKHAWAAHYMRRNGKKFE